MRPTDTDLRGAPPHDIEAEQAVLGSMILDNSTNREVRELLTAESFLRDAHQRIFAAILAIDDADVPVDEITLFDELKRRGQLADIGDGELTAEYIGEILESTATAATAE